MNIRFGKNRTAGDPGQVFQQSANAMKAAASGQAMAARAEPAPVRLSAVVVTYNRLGQIRATLTRLLEEPCDRIYVVDNGSTDGTRAWLAQQADPRLRVILSSENVGGAGGFERGLRETVARDDPDWVVVMDDDARPYPGCLAGFLGGAASGWDAVSSAVYACDGAICEINRPTINPFWNLPTFLRTLLGTCIGRARRGFHVPDAAYRGGPVEIDATSFVGLFLSRSSIRRVGYPDGQMFIYGDDVLYTLRLRKAGLRIGFLPDLRFEHDHSGHARGSRAIYTPLWKTYYDARNGLRVYRAAAGALFWPVMPVVLAKWLLAGRHYGENRTVYYRLLWLGLKDGMRGHRRPHSEITALANADARVAKPLRTQPARR